MLRSLISGAMALVFASASALAADVSVGFVQGPGGYYNPQDRSGPYSISSSGALTLLGSAGGGGGGGGGSVTQGTSPWVDKLQVGGADVSASNPLPMLLGSGSSVGLSGSLPSFASTPTFNVGTIGGIASQTTLASVLASLGSPFQAGASIGNTAFGISGNLPAFAATPTFNVGTIAGIATQTTSAAILSALGSPFQAGGSIGNTAFGISGTLPAFAATPTFNLGTLGGAATALNQTSTQGSVAPGTAAANSTLAGGVYNSTAPTLTNGQQAALQFDAAGNLKVTGGSGGGSAASQTASNGSDGQATSTTNQQTVAFPFLFNGSTFDRWRGTGGSANIALTAGTAQFGSLLDNVSPAGYPASMSATGQTAVFSTAGYQSLDLGFSGTWAGNITLEGSYNGGATWVGIYCNLSSNFGSNTETNAFSANSAASCKVAPQMRVNVTTLSSGPVTVTVNLRNTPYAGRGVYVGGGSIGAAGAVSAASGGVSNLSRLVSAAPSTNATLAKSSAGRVYSVYACNDTATVATAAAGGTVTPGAPVYIHLVNLATTPVPGTSAVFRSRVLPAGTSGAPLCQKFDDADIGAYLSAGIGYWLSKGAGGSDTDTTALAAGDVKHFELAYQ